MKPATWLNVRELFEGAMDLPATERADWVARAAADSEELQLAVNRLLASASEERDYLTPPASLGVVARAVGGTLPQPGTRIGAFVLGQVIGAGGMGSVFLAHQARPSRNVAVKLMRPGFVTADAVRRFELEGEVLGRLRHPGIATIFELGTYVAAHEGGSLPTPFLAMEFVEGARDIVSFAREEKLGMRARIELFREVCAAVQHAHRMGVIHRDLKPGNVLVDASGRAKVIDFGVARVVAPGLEGGVGTLGGQAFGTLQYASPEQLSGDWRDVDVRTDVYALGALLYELLALRPYCEIAERSIAAVIEDVCELEPPPPSCFAAGLPRELDWITLRCLRKDREDRYGSVEELGADLARFANDEPVAAGPASASYRARKFVSRNRLAVGAGVLVLGSLIGGLVATSLALRKAKREFTRAEDALVAKATEATRANDALRRQTAVVEALERILGAVAPNEDGRTVTLFELLERERPKLDSEFAEDPGLRAALQSFLGAAYQSLGLSAESDEMLSAAVTVLEQQADTDPEQLAWLRLMLAKGRTSQSRFAEAEELFDASLPVLDRLGKLHSANGIRGLRLHAGLLAKAGETGAAAESYRRVVELSEELLGAENVDTIMAMSQLAKQLSALRKCREALDWARKAHERALRAFDPEHPLTLFTAMGLGEALQARGILAEAVPVLRDVLARSERTYGKPHPNSIHATEVLAWALVETGELDEAEALARDALETALTYQSSVLDLELWARICIGDVLAARREALGSAEQLQLALERLVAADMPGHPAHFRLRWALAELDLAAGRSEAGEQLVRWEEQRAHDAVGEQAKNLDVARGLYGRALWAQGSVDEARDQLLACEQSLSTWTDARLAALSDEVLDTLVDVCAKLGDEHQRQRFEAIRRGDSSAPGASPPDVQGQRER